MRFTDLLVILFLLSFSINTFSQSICPKGKTYCEGECGRFVDEDGDGCCDLVIKDSSKKSSHNSSQEIVDIKLPKEKSLDSQTIDIETISLEVENDDEIIEQLSVQISNNTSKEKNQNQKRYSLILISSITIGLYLFSSLLVRIKLIKKITHRKIWNTLLLISFLGSCILGFLLVIQLNYNVLNSIYLLNLKLHVEFGIAMTIISVFHVFWHIKYFKRILGISSKCNE